MVNTDEFCSPSKIDRYFNQNHLGVLLLAMGIPCTGHFDEDYDKLIGIIEGYSGKFSLFEKLLMKVIHF